MERQSGHSREIPANIQRDAYETNQVRPLRKITESHTNGCGLVYQTPLLAGSTSRGSRLLFILLQIYGKRRGALFPGVREVGEIPRSHQSNGMGDATSGPQCNRNGNGANCRSPTRSGCGVPSSMRSSHAANNGGSIRQIHLKQELNQVKAQVIE